MPQLVFFVRCRPQDADIIDLVLDTKRVFIGYPAFRENVEFSCRAMRRCLVDPLLPREEWARMKSLIADYSREMSKNHNLAHEVEPGSLVLVPRPDRGVVYVGEVRDRFEIVDAPPWVGRYLGMRVKQGAGKGYGLKSHVGDVVQGWQVKSFSAIPFSIVPAWIRSSLFGRATYGRVRERAYEGMRLDPMTEMHRALENRFGEHLKWTTDRHTVERRLVHHVGPSSLEHLCVDLLRLERPEEIWMHVGGSGDGGVDGLGYDRRGHLTGVLQCKFEYHGEELPFARANTVSAARFVASLLHGDDIEPSNEGVIFLSRRWIADAVLRHSEHLPLARTLRVGEPSGDRSQ